MGNLLSLEEWREDISYNPFHFWGMSGSKVPVMSSCNSVVKKYSWQTADSAGREDIIEAIKTAEDRILPYLGFSVAPHFAEVTLPFPRYPKDDVTRIGYAGSDNRWITLQLPEGYIDQLGVEKRDVIALNVPVVTSDADGDGLTDTFSFTIPIPATMTLTDIQQVAVYYSSTDRLDSEPVDEKWRISPLMVSISAGNVTVRGRYWQIGKPIKYEGFSTEDNLDPDVPGNFVTTLDVYRRYCDPNGLTVDDCQVMLIWETPPYPTWAAYGAYPGTTLDPSAQAYSIARGVIRDATNGIIGFGESYYDSASGEWYAIPWYGSIAKFRPPDRVKIRYYAGYPFGSRNGQLDSRMSKIVSCLSIAELTRRICACDTANRTIYKWQFDLSRSSGANDESYGLISSEDLSNPLGTCRGHLFAWHAVKANRILKGFSV